MKSKEQKREMFDRLAPQRARWRRRNRGYYRELEKHLGFLIPPQGSLLEIGSGTGDTLAALRPSPGHGTGMGIDFSPEMVRIARERHPHLTFSRDDAEAPRTRGAFDHILMSDLVGELSDVWAGLRGARGFCHPGSRLVVTSFNGLWEPVFRLGERLGVKMPQDHQNWLAPEDLENLLLLNGFEVVQKGYRILFPYPVPLLSPLLNRFAAKLPLLRKLCLTFYLVARPVEPPAPRGDLSVSVIVPCRNEKGNIRAAVERTPAMGRSTEIVFVDGDSSDGTVEEIEAVMREYAGRKEIRLIHQVPPGSREGAGHGRMLRLGKGDAVRKGFDAAAGEVLMILDADLTVPPEELPKFYLALAEGRGEFINGTRLVYPMEKEAMRFLNKLANKFFSFLFTWLLSQRIKDTLCGTKVLLRQDYRKIVAGREYFGDFDPFGDFDLLFGASKLSLRIVEVPIRYRERTYGEIKIERFRHGLLLLKMSAIAFWRIKLD
jgi:SAM-dependent methyltransferase